MPAVIPIIVAATAAAGTYAAAKAQSNGATSAANIQANAANHAADVQGASTDKALEFQKMQAENDFRNQVAVQRANYQQYLARANAAKSLGASLGFNIPDPSPFVEPTDPNYTGAATTGSQTGASGMTATGGASAQTPSTGAAALQKLLSSGIDPQTAAKTFNQQFGRTTGNEAVYYPQNNTIGLPEGYLSTGQNGWQFTPRGASGGSSAGTLGGLMGLAPAAATIQPLAAQPGTALTPPGYTPFTPGTLGAA